MDKLVYVILAFTFFLLASCDHIDVSERMAAVPQHEWLRDDKLPVELDIADSGHHYILLVIRHNEKFDFTHLPVKISIQDTTKKAKPFLTMLVNAPLINTSGKWAGTNMDDLYYHRIKIDRPVLLDSNRYRFVLQHEIKEGPIRNILDVGVAVEKIKTPS